MTSRPMSTLGKLALAIGITGSFSLYAIRWMIQIRIRESPIYKEAMKYLHNDANAIEILGEPIKEKKVNISDKNCYGGDENIMWVRVPLKGEKHSGVLQYWVTKDEKRATDKIQLSKIELMINGSETNKITLKNDPVVASIA